MVRGDPKVVFQTQLDILSDVSGSGDLDGLRSHFSLPLLHRSMDSEVLIETPGDFKRGVLSFQSAIQAKGANQAISLVSDAEYLGPDYLQGTYVTHLLRDEVPVVRSYTNRSVMRRTPDGWKTTEVEMGILHHSWPIKVFTVPDDAPVFSNRAEDDVRREALEPLAIYQTFINSLTRANVSKDFTGYCELCLFPYSAHTENGDEVFHGPADVRPFFDCVTRLLNDCRVQDYARIADSATFLRENMICGYHTTRFMRDGADALDPIKSRMILRRKGTRWFLHSVTNAIRNDTTSTSVPDPADDLVTQREIQERTNTWPTLH